MSNGDKTTTGQGHDVYLGIADSTRRGILTLLAGTELSIASITKYFSLSRTAINKHLGILLDAGLVKKRERGRETIYSLKPENLSELREWLRFFDSYWDEQLNRLKKSIESEDD
jgi:DNA-binding transcriptional ArsR family regulator